jgi:uncharacterized protein (UPF0335 family)
MSRQHSSSMVARRLQACLERVERVERKVDCKACDGTSLEKFLVSGPG